MSVFRTRTIDKQIVIHLVRSLFPNITYVKSDWDSLKTWALASFRDYNMVLRSGLRKLVPDFIKKYR